MFQPENHQGFNLRQAISKGDWDTIFQLLEGKSQNTMLELIQEKGALSGKTALHRLVEKLIESHVPKTLNIIGITFTKVSDTRSYEALTAYLLALKPNLNIQDSKGVTLSALLDTVPKDGCLQKMQEQFNEPDQGLELRKAVARQDSDSIRVILLTKAKEERRALLQSQGPESGKTAVHIACEALVACSVADDQPMIVNVFRSQIWRGILSRFLCDHGSINLDIPDSKGITVNQLLAQLPPDVKTSLMQDNTAQRDYLTGYVATSCSSPDSSVR
ncbi:MAG: hypothetical protein ACHP6H_00245 [Legionellales bacterium]